jgi:hypothetical protein
VKRLPVGSLLIAGLLVLVGALLWANDRKDARVDALADSLRTERIEATARDLGWRTRYAQEVEHGQRLEDLLEDTTVFFDREIAALSREVELLDGRLSLAAEVVASMQGQIEATAAVVFLGDSAHTGESVYGSVSRIDSISGDVSDGLLSAHVRATVEPPTVAIPRWSIDSLHVALGLVDAPDGRQLLTARAADPRVTLAIGDVFVQPPAPVQFCSLGTRVKDHGRGYAAGRLIELLISQVSKGFP